jgi:flagellar biosynthesis GTPase FlhF
MSAHEKSMRLKSYFSGSVEAAMQLARRELGDEAMLVHSRPATPETRYLGAYEVVFGTDQAPTPAPQPTIAAAPLGVDRLSQDVSDLRRQIERLTLSLQPHSPASPALICKADPTLGRAGSDRAIVALVGPPGVGKTTTLVKLAARYGLACRRPTQILTADLYRIAAADQLRALSAILGIGCDVVETPVALAQALEEYRSKDLVLIDTPGLSFREMEDGEDLARLLSSHPEIDTHLVLSASMKPSVISRFIDHYSIFHPGKLIFTRLDETTEYNALISQAAKRGLPVSFLTTGQQIPDDLEEATEHHLCELLSQESSSTFGAAA